LSGGRQILYENVLQIYVGWKYHMVYLNMYQQLMMIMYIYIVGGLG
jgi:hypothetical protein